MHTLMWLTSSTTISKAVWFQFRFFKIIAYICAIGCRAGSSFLSRGVQNWLMVDDRGGQQSTLI